MNQNWEKPTYISWRSEVVIQKSILACSLARVEFVEMIDIDNKHPTLWMDKYSVKEGFDLTWERTSAPWGFEVSVATKYN